MTLFYLLLVLFILQSYLILSILNTEYFTNNIITYETAKIELNNQYYIPPYDQMNKNQLFRDDNIYQSE